MRSLPLLPTLSLLPALLSSCDDPRTETRRYQNEGGICLSPRVEGGAHVQVVLNDCESFCADLEASCSVAVEAGVIVVTAEGTATWDPDSSSSCPDACAPVEARCQLPALPEGVYELRYGERAVSVQVPVLSRAGVIQEMGRDNVCAGLPALP